MTIPDRDAADVSISLHSCGPAMAVLANPAGACAQVRAAWGSLESKYDAFLAANPDKSGPHDRQVILTKIRQWLQTGNETREVTPASVTDFALLSPRAVEWSFYQQGLRWKIRLVLSEGNAVRLTWEMLGDAGSDARFYIRPELESRSFHAVTAAYEGADAAYPAAVHDVTAQGFSFHTWPDASLVLDMPGASFLHEPEWSWQVPLAIEAGRGLPSTTDLYSAGSFTWQPGTTPVIHLTAAVPPDAPPSAEPTLHYPPALPLPQVMRHALDLFLARRDQEITAIAGYPWFLDWGRDSLIFARGLIAAGRVGEAASILRRFAEWEDGGSIPNVLRGRDASNRETSDAPLWLVIVLRDLAAAVPDVLHSHAGSRTLQRICCDLISAHTSRTAHGVRMDPQSGLLWSPAHYTWMDTDAPAGTPRQGYPICIQSLWAAALDYGHTLSPGHGWDLLAAKVRASIARLYWRPGDGFLSDTLHGGAGLAAADCIADDHLRPNQLLAITLGAIRNPNICRSIINECRALLVPGALRTLAQRPVTMPLPVEWEGRALHDPLQPYHGRYEGPENTSRKPAYHNGTAWPWLFPSWCEALLATEGPDAIPQARRWMSSTADLLQHGCIGQLPEIIDGDAPHCPRGCPAQAWSASEWVRVWQLLA